MILYCIIIKMPTPRLHGLAMAGNQSGLLERIRGEAGGRREVGGYFPMVPVTGLERLPPSAALTM